MENLGDIVIAPRVLEVITGIAAAKVDGVYALRNKAVSDGLVKTNKGRGVYLHTDEEGNITADIYVYMQYGVSVPSVAMEIQKAVRSAVLNYADVEIAEANIHVIGIASDKTPKPDLKDLFNEDFLDD
ncbi:putative alkaline shock family protein YloU [Streptococcus moroccensis]|uniref:Alkaline shock family protein YloU n=2 Tax=Streptococcus moroccensis TaxID=1451356 RepID=A0ABT9YRZ2_9STRE|nr:putative alkaline shock family protein YloU [Streptococcus moroccensis]